jgi:uncharacterized protein YqeY
MRDSLNSALKEAVKAKDKVRVSTLRLINAAIKDRDIAARTGDRRDPVSNDEILQILSKMIKQRRESSTTYEEAGRLDLSEQENQEIVVIEEYLPRQLGLDEIRAACQAVIGELAAEGLKDMGKCMGALKERFAGQMDFGKASGIIKELLG